MNPQPDSTDHDGGPAKLLADGTGVTIQPEQIFRDYAPRIYHIARRLLGNDADAEDVTQEVLLQVIRKLHTFRGEAALPTWLHRITVNAALALREKRSNRAKRETPVGGDNDGVLAMATANGRSNGTKLPRTSSEPAQLMLQSEQRDLIDQAIAELPEQFRDVYVLADVEGLPNADIADCLNLSVPAVKSRLHRARLKMRDSLAPHFEEVTP